MAGSLLADSADAAVDPFAVRTPHFAGKAKHVIHLFMNGGPSHVDTFDPKPVLEKYAGQPLPYKNPGTERPTGGALPSPFKFRKYGRERHRGERPVPARGPLDRRYCRGAVDARRCAEPRAIVAVDELRRWTVDSPQRWFMGHLWPGQHEPELTGVCLAMPRLSHSRIAKLAGGFFARRLPSNLREYPPSGSRAADRQY